MTGVPIIATATSTGTGTTKTQLNGGSSLKLPDQVKTIHSVIPYTIPTAALTAAEAIEQNFFVESNDVDCLPCQIAHVGAIGGLGTFASAMSPILQSYDVNIPVSKSPNMNLYGQSLTANTAAVLAGLELLVSDGSPRGKQKYWTNPAANTSTGTAAARVTGSAYSFANASRITDLYAYAVTGTVTASDSVGGYAEFSSSDFRTPLPVKMAIQPIITALGTAVAVALPSMSRRKVMIPVRNNVTVTEYMNMEQALTAAGTFMTGLAFER